LKGQRLPIAFVLIGLAMLGAAHGTPGQAAQAEQVHPKPLEYEVGVALKLIHVYVTDKKGKPIPDLGRDEFELFDNGTPVTITEFERHSTNLMAGEPLPNEASEPTRGTPVSKQAARKFFLFFDLAFNNARGIGKAKEAALRFIKAQAGPEDEIGVLSYSIFGGIIVHEFLTKDRDKVREVLEKIDQGGLVGRAEEIEYQYWSLISEYQPSESPVSGGRTPAYIYEAIAAREQLKAESQTFIFSLTTLAKALRVLPGQKLFMLFSSGVPSSVIYGNQAGNANEPPSSSTSSLAGRKFDPGDPKLRAANEAMFKEFAASGCAFYSFDTREPGKSRGQAGSDDLARPSGVSLFTYGAAPSVSEAMITGGNYLKRISDVTGGRYFANINAFEKNLDQVQALTGTYYVLGYGITERWDGRFHDIKVKVNRKGCEVRAQAGYFNPKPYSEYTKLEKELHLYDLALNERAFSRLPVNVPMAPLVYGGGPGQRLGIVAGIPGDVTAKLSGRRVEYVVIFFDEKGEVSGVVRTEADPARVRGQNMIFSAAAELGPGTYSCRLVARDMDTGSSAVGSAVATIGTPRTAGLQLSTPLILTEGAAIAHVDAGPAGKKEALPLAEIYTYDRSRLSPVVSGLPVGHSAVQAMVPYWAPGEAEPDLAFSAYVIDAKTGARTAVGFSRVDRIRGGSQGLLSFEITLAGLAPGTYYLHFHGEDRASKTVGHAYTTLIVSQH
jgi:VWFA-related protein